MLRPLLKERHVERVVSTVLRSSLVDESAAFLARELPRRRTLARYHVRTSHRPIWIRHASSDVPTLDEVFYQRQYEVLPAVLENLSGLGRPARVLDLGANIGLFGVFILAELPSEVELTAVEPDQANLAVLRRTATENGGWRILAAAAATKAGTVPFVSAGGSLSRVDERAPDRVDAIDVFELLSDSDLVKMDIEGAEWPILKDARLAATAAAAIVLEYHPATGMTGDEARAAATSSLEAAGFTCQAVLQHEHGAGVLWATR
jgi:FkbM family methyltransferase